MSEKNDEETIFFIVHTILSIENISIIKTTTKSKKKNNKLYIQASMEKC